MLFPVIGYIMQYEFGSVFEFACDLIALIWKLYAFNNIAYWSSA